LQLILHFKYDFFVATYTYSYLHKIDKNVSIYENNDYCISPIPAN